MEFLAGLGRLSSQSNGHNSLKTTMPATAKQRALAYIRGADGLQAANRPNRLGALSTVGSVAPLPPGVNYYGKIRQVPLKPPPCQPIPIREK